MRSNVVKPDLDSKENIENFIDAFYNKVLVDERLAPIFLAVAEVDLAVHLPHIQRYWQKLLLGDKEYKRHTMNIHRALHGKQALTEEDFGSWLGLFIATVDEGYEGEKSEQAKRIATSIAGNMHESLSSVAEGE